MAKQKSGDKQGHVFSLIDVSVPDKRSHAALAYAQRNARANNQQAHHFKALLAEAINAAKMGDCSKLELVHQDFVGVRLPGFHSESPIMQPMPGYKVTAGICSRCGEFYHHSRDCDAPKSQQEINKEPHHTWEPMKRPLQQPPRMSTRQESS